jgi:hypothetical protein
VCSETENIQPSFFWEKREIFVTSLQRTSINKDECTGLFPPEMNDARYSWALFTMDSQSLDYRAGSLQQGVCFLVTARSCSIPASWRIELSYEDTIIPTVATTPATPNVAIRNTLGEIINGYKTLIGTTERKMPLARPSRRGKDATESAVKE